MPKLINAWLLTACSILTIGCASSTKLNKKKDYLRSTNYLLKEQPLQALEALPSTEKSGFIELSERAWLSLISSEPMSSKKLIELGKELPTKETVIVSNELEHFYYQKTPEGYFPAEHEVIFFHLVNAMLFLRGGNNQAAEVEARKAAFYLQDDYVSHAGGFDSPQLRVWLASIWAALGDWNKAQVDLRNAAKLSKDFKWAAELAKKKKTPKYLTLVFQGIGAEPVYDPKGLSAHLTGKGSLKFEEQDPKELVVSGSQSKSALKQESMIRVYERHQDRNDEIREVIEQSDYMLKSSLIYSSGAVAKASGIAAAGTMIATGIAAGLSVAAVGIYIAAQATGEASFYIAGAAIGAGWWTFKFFKKAGVRLSSSVNKSVDKGTSEALNVAKTYRFVRYIPSKIGLFWSDKKPIFVERLNKTKKGDVMEPLRPFLEISNENSRVEFLYSTL